MLEIKRSVIEIKNAFNRLISSLVMTMEVISSSRGLSTEAFQTDMQRGKNKWKKKYTEQNTQACKTTKRFNIHITGIQEEEKRIGHKIFE